jgi:hypothetical protein
MGRLLLAPRCEVTAPGCREIGERLGVCIAMDRAQPRLSVGVEPVGMRVFDAVELLFQRHRIRALGG